MHPFMTECKAVADQYIQQYIPRKINNEWLEQVSGKIRFGWDIQGIQVGFIDILYDYLDEFHARLRPIFLIKLAMALEIDLDQLGPALTGLELLYIANMMINKVDNVNSIAVLSKTSKYPMAVLLTTAYSARQLSPAIINIFDPKLSQNAKSQLVYHLGGYLVRQGLILTLDYWNSQQKKIHTEKDSLINYIKLFVTPLTFKLVIDILSVVTVNLNKKYIPMLSQVSEDLGLAYRLTQIAKIASNNNVQYNEPCIRWLDFEQDIFVYNIQVESENSKKRLTESLDKLPIFLQNPIVEFAEEILSG